MQKIIFDTQLVNDWSSILHTVHFGHCLATAVNYLHFYFGHTLLMSDCHSLYQHKGQH